MITCEKQDKNCTIKDTPKKSNENEWKIIGGVKKWVRNCPNCKNECLYSLKPVYTKSLKLKKCIKCSNKGKVCPWRGIKKEYIGICLCGFSRKFKHASNYFASKKKEFRCNNCAKIKFKEYLLETNNHSSKDKKKEFNRICPSCSDIIYYSSRTMLQRAIYNNKNCRKCADTQHRLWSIENRKNVYPRYNSMSIPIFNQINKQLGWNLQHAENGGEFHIKELGYFVDAYDKDRNIVVEFDELHHSKFRIKQYDLKRQQEIIEYFGCKFYRIKYNQKWDDIISCLSDK